MTICISTASQMVGGVFDHKAPVLVYVPVHMTADPVTGHIYQKAQGRESHRWCCKNDRGAFDAVLEPFSLEAVSSLPPGRLVRCSGGRKVQQRFLSGVPRPWTNTRRRPARIAPPSMSSRFPMFVLCTLTRSTVALMYLELPLTHQAMQF